MSRPRILFRATDADDETIDDGAVLQALFRTLDHTDEAIVRGGYLLLMVMPNVQGTYAIGNYLEVYVGLLGMSPEELRPHEAFVHGGFLMGLVMPQPGPNGRMLDPPLVNVLDAYLHLMEDNLRRAQEIHANS